MTLLALLTFGLLALVMTWPTVANLGSRLAGQRDDLWVHQWNFWWAKQVITTGQNPFYTYYLYHPGGVSLTSHNIPWFNIALWLPLQAIVGRVAAYNLIFMAVFALNGFAMWLFAYELTQSYQAAFIAGVVYGFWPYTMSHFDHANMMVVFWVPLMLLYLRRTLKGQRIRDALIAALLLAMTGITRWQLVIMSGPVVVGYLLYLLLTERECRTRRILGRLVLVAVVAGALMAPLAFPLVVDQLTRDYPEDAFLDEPTWGRTDLMALIAPTIYNSLWRDKVSHLYENFTVNKNYVPYLGYTTMVVALFGAVREWRRARIWFLLAILYLTLVLGPELAIDGRVFPQIPMPYRLVEDWFIFRMLRRPDRLNVFTSFPMAMLAAWGTVALLRQRFAGWKSTLIVGLLAGLILVDYAPIPFPMTPTTVPAWYRELAHVPDQFAVLDLPLNDRRTDKWYMYYQTTHGKPLVVGHVSRMPREAFNFMDEIPVWGTLLRRPDDLTPDEVPDISHQLHILNDAGVRYIVIHKRFVHEGHLEVWQDWLNLKPFHEDDEVFVYRTTPKHGTDFDLVLRMTDEIGIIEVTYAPEEAIQEGTIKVDARWGTVAAVGRDIDVCLTLHDTNGQLAQSHCEGIVPTWPSSKWQADEVVRGYYVMPVNDLLEPGTYTLTMALVDTATGMPDGNSTNLGTVSIRPFEPAHTTRVKWDQTIQLVGYDLEESADVLELTLYWQAQQRVDTSYKTFIHLVDPGTGTLVQQSDTVPRDWTYPTHAWDPGEIVHDVIKLPLEDVPSGQYELGIGLYHWKKGYRLAVRCEGGVQCPDNTYFFATVQHTNDGE
jgi:hypothetical protein